MNNSKAKIYYIYHSGFALESENYLLIFDYYKEPIIDKQSPFLPSLLSNGRIKGNKKVFVFSSHSHGDHFNPEIFDFTKYNSNVTYILSKDIEIDAKKQDHVFMEEGDTLEIEGLYVKAFGSTDIGISFLVSADNLSIFHAGDLNWWHWKEDPLEERQAAEANFKIQIDKIKKEKVIDIAFFPVDPRLEEFYYIGGQYFGEQLRPKLLIPMHFGGETWITRKFYEQMDKLGIKTAQINNTLQEINFPQ